MSNLPVLAPQLTIATPPGTALAPTGAIPLGPAPMIDVGQATYARPQPIPQQSGLGALKNQLNVGNATAAMSAKDVGRVLSGKAVDAAKGAVGALRGGAGAAGSTGAAGAATSAGNASAYASLLDDAAVAGANAGKAGAWNAVKGSYLGKGAALKGLGYGIAGQLAATGIDAVDIGGQESVWDRALTGAAGGAGAGAGIGAVFGGVGALPGAIAGAGLGALGNVVYGLSGDHATADSVKATNDKVNRVGDMARSVGMDDNTRKALGLQADQAIQMIEAQTGQPATAAQRSAVLDNVLNLIGQYQTDPDSVLAAIGVKPQQDAQQILRWQTMLNDYMRPFAEKSNQTGQLAEASMMAAAQNETYAPLRQAYEAQAKSLAAVNANAASAVMRSANAVPLVTIADENRQLQRQMAQLESQLAQNSGGGGDDLAALMEG